MTFGKSRSADSKNKHIILIIFRLKVVFHVFFTHLKNEVKISPTTPYSFHTENSWTSHTALSKHDLPPNPKDCKTCSSFGNKIARSAPYIVPFNTIFASCSKNTKNYTQIQSFIKMLHSFHSTLTNTFFLGSPNPVSF